MSSKITKDNIDNIFKDLGKEYRRISGTHTPAELVIAGGACMLAKYDFREDSMDVDAIIRAGSTLQEAATKVEEKYGLQHNWLNSDFMKTDSYSDKLLEHSQYYRTFSNILEIRTVKVEYLLATKLCSAREYKHGLSDIIGVIKEERSNGNNIDQDSILAAYKEMYGGLPDIDMQIFLDRIYITDDLDELYDKYAKAENTNKEILLDFHEKYPGVIKNTNREEIFDKIFKKIDVDKSEDATIDENGKETTDMSYYLEEDDDIDTSDDPVD